jgi:hypothetical protein
MLCTGARFHSVVRGVARAAEGMPSHHICVDAPAGTNGTQRYAAKAAWAMETSCVGARSPRREGSCQGGPTRQRHKRDSRVEANETDRWAHATVDDVYAGALVVSHWRAGLGCRRVYPRAWLRSGWMGRLRGFPAQVLGSTFPFSFYFLLFSICKFQILKLSSNSCFSL